VISPDVQGPSTINAADPLDHTEHYYRCNTEIGLVQVWYQLKRGRFGPWKKAQEIHHKEQHQLAGGGQKCSIAQSQNRANNRRMKLFPLLQNKKFVVQVESWQRIAVL